MSFVKYRVKEVANDFGITPKEVSEIVGKFMEKPKSYTQVLTDAELNVVFDYMTQKNQIKDLAQVFAVKPAPKTEAPKAEAPARAAAPQNQGNRPQQGQNRPQQQGNRPMQQGGNRPQQGQNRPQQPQQQAQHPLLALQPAQQLPHLQHLPHPHPLAREATLAQ